jgi:hypothetical protein
MSGNLREEGLFFQNSDPGLVAETTPFAPGQLGKVAASDQSANQSSFGQVPGVYQYVLRYATDTASTPAVGDLAYWRDATNFVVTAYPALANLGVDGTTFPIPAGVFAGTALAAGSYGFIQVGGLGFVRVSDSTSGTSTQVGRNLIFLQTNQVQPIPTQTTTVTAPAYPVVGVLAASAGTGTGTSLSALALITPPRMNW